MRADSCNKQNQYVAVRLTGKYYILYLSGFVKHAESLICMKKYWKSTTEEQIVY